MPVILVSSHHFRRLSQALQAGGRWVYIGKDRARLEAITGLVGDRRRLPLGEQLNEISEDLRQPFLDFVAEIGALQRDHIGWYASTFAWKIWDVSDLFLLICYQSLVAKLIAEWTAGSERLVVVIEDRWLYQQLEDVFKDRRSVTFTGKPALWPWKFKTMLVGLGRRFWWAGRVAWSWQLQRWYRRGVNLQRPAAPAAAIFSLPQKQCLAAKTGWKDPYLDGLDRSLAAAGFAVARFSPPEAVGFEQDLARRALYFSPLVLFVPFSSLWRSIAARWHPVWPSDLQVADRDVRWLALREWWWDTGRASQFLFRLLYESSRRFLASAPWSLVVFPYENQPWEKLLVLAAREQGIKTVGYQHAIVPRLFLSMFFGHGEAAQTPLPDVIFASGDQTYRLLLKGGTPAAQLAMGGSRRYQHLSKTELPAGGTVPEPGIQSRVLVVLPIDKVLAEHLMSALSRAFPLGGEAEGIRFLMKEHPAAPFAWREETFSAEPVRESLETALNRCGTVLFAGSSAGLEAWLLGRRVLRYRSELLLDLNHCEVLEGHDIPLCDDWNLRQKLLQVTHDSEPSGRLTKIEALREQLFSPVDEGEWVSRLKELVNAT